MDPIHHDNSNIPQVPQRPSTVRTWGRRIVNVVTRVANPIVRLAQGAWRSLSRLFRNVQSFSRTWIQTTQTRIQRLIRRAPDRSAPIEYEMTTFRTDYSFSDEEWEDALENNVAQARRIWLDQTIPEVVNRGTLRLHQEIQSLERHLTAWLASFLRESPTNTQAPLDYDDFISMVSLLGQERIQPEMKTSFHGILDRMASHRGRRMFQMRARASEQTGSLEETQEAALRQLIKTLEQEHLMQEIEETCSEEFSNSYLDTIQSGLIYTNTMLEDESPSVIIGRSPQGYFGAITNNEETL